MVLPYVPDCEVVEIDDGTLLVTHLGSGRTRTATTDRQALIAGTALAIAATLRQADSPCKNGHIGPIITDPAAGTKKCRTCGMTVIWG